MARKTLIKRKETPEEYKLRHFMLERNRILQYMRNTSGHTFISFMKYEEINGKIKRKNYGIKTRIILIP